MKRIPIVSIRPKMSHSATVASHTYFTTYCVIQNLMRIHDTQIAAFIANIIKRFKRCLQRNKIFEICRLTVCRVDPVDGETGI